MQSAEGLHELCSLDRQIESFNNCLGVCFQVGCIHLPKSQSLKLYTIAALSKIECLSRKERSMSQEDKQKWDQRYATDDYRKTNPVDLLHEWGPRLKAGRALDVACGAGRNALYLAELGFAVDAIDISTAGLNIGRQLAAEQQLSINWIEQDLDGGLVIDESYDLIVVFWFVNMPLITELCRHLKPGGYLISSQHLAVEGDLSGPRSSRFRIQPDELRSAVDGLDIVYYHEGIQQDDDGGTLASAAVVAKNAD